MLYVMAYIRTQISVYLVDCKGVVFNILVLNAARKLIRERLPSWSMLMIF